MKILPNRRAAFLYLLMAGVGALAIILGFGVLVSLSELFVCHVNSFVMGDQLMHWLMAIVQILLFIVLAPLLAGWIKCCCKCRLQNRKAPSIFQPYRDLLKLTHKQPVVSEQASWLFIKAPYIIFSATVLAATVVPLIAVDLPTSASADVIVMVGFFAFARFFLALAGFWTSAPLSAAWAHRGK